MDMRSTLRKFNPNPLDSWELEGKLYLICKDEANQHPYSLCYASDISGGVAQFASLDALETHVERYGLRQVVEVGGQFTLGL